MLRHLLGDLRYGARRFASSAGFAAAAATLALDVSSTDGVALGAAALVVVGVAVAARVLPARRASRVDPNAGLRYE